MSHVANRLSCITSCTFFNLNLWSSWSKGVGSKLKAKEGYELQFVMAMVMGCQWDELLVMSTYFQAPNLKWSTIYKPIIFLFLDVASLNLSTQKCQDLQQVVECRITNPMKLLGYWWCMYSFALHTTLSISLHNSNVLII